MLKKALATAGIAAVAIVGAGAGMANAADQAPADGGAQAKALPDTTDICNSPIVSDPDHKDSYVAILDKKNPLNQVISSLLKGTTLVAGVCNSTEQKADKGDGGKGGDAGKGGSQTPTPLPAPGGDTSGQGDGPSFPLA
jgi:hypothetical protein